LLRNQYPAVAHILTHSIDLAFGPKSGFKNICWDRAFIWDHFTTLHCCAQGRPLADWTDCFQSAPAPKEAPRCAYKLTQIYAFNRKCLVSACTGPTVFSKRGARCHRK